MSAMTVFKTLHDHGFLCDTTSGWCEKHQPDGSVLFVNPYTSTAEEVRKGVVTPKNYDDTLKRVKEGLA